VRNRGAKLAKADILVFIDSDTIPGPGFVRHHIKCLAEHDVSLGKILIDGREIRRKLSPGWKSLYSGNFSVKRLLFDKVLGFSEFFEGWGVEDQELGYKLYKEGASFGLSEASVTHQAHEPFYKSMLEKRISVIVNAKKFYEVYKDEKIAKAYRLDKRLLSADVYNKCNNNCVFCRRLERAGNYLEIPEILDLLEKLDSGWTIKLTGGEVLLRKDLFALASAVRNMGHDVMLASNARAFAYKSLADKCALFKEIVVTLFAHDDALYKSIAGCDGFNQAEIGIRNLIDAGLNISFDIILSEENRAFLRQIIGYSQSFSKAIPFRVTLDCVNMGMQELDFLRSNGLKEEILDAR
jgi:uncharacterized radical SAM superfamily Fe-S cluster-containing enzyme